MMRGQQKQVEQKSLDYHKGYFDGFEAALKVAEADKKSSERRVA